MYERGVALPCRQVESSIALILGSETHEEAFAAVTAAVITSTPLVASTAVLKTFPFLIDVSIVHLNCRSSNVQAFSGHSSFIRSFLKEHILHSLL